MNQLQGSVEELQDAVKQLQKNCCNDTTDIVPNPPGTYDRNYIQALIAEWFHIPHVRWGLLVQVHTVTYLYLDHVITCTVGIDFLH